MPLSEIFKQFFFLIDRCVLWLVGLLALVGMSWRGGGFAVSNLSVTALLAALSALLLGVAVASVPKNHRIRCIHWIPVLLLGLQFPLRAMLLYFVVVVWLGCLFFLLPTVMFSKPDKPRKTIPCDDAATQQIRRFQTENGRDCLEAIVTVEFMENQKIAAVHVPFWPLFPETPRIETDVETATEITVAKIKTQPFGVRLEVRRQTEKAGRYRLRIYAEC